MKKYFLTASVLLTVLVQPIFSTETLQQVIILTRHGVRAPTWTAERLNGYSSDPWPDFGVPPGYLTQRGRLLMKIMGAYYRETYLAEGILGQTQCEDAKKIYIWADTDQRTLETGRALAEGLLPKCHIDVHSMPEGKPDALFDPIEAGVAKPDPAMLLAAVQGRIGLSPDVLTDTYRTQLMALDQILTGGTKTSKSIFDERPSITADHTGVTMSGPLAVSSTFTQNLLLEYANGFSGKDLGWGRITPSGLRDLLLLHTSYAELMRRTPYLASVRGANLLDHIAQTLEQSATSRTKKGALGPSGTNLVVVVGHDTNISNLSGIMRLSWTLPTYQPDDAPPGGALVFSLWRSEKGIFTVTVKIVAQTLDQMHELTPLTSQNPAAHVDLFIPGCSLNINGYPCKWEDFKQITSSASEREFISK